MTAESVLRADGGPGGAQVLLDPAYGWRESTHGVHYVASAGPAQGVADFLSGLPANRDWDETEVFAALDRLPGCYGFVIQGPHRTWALVDRVRAYPLFYAGEGPGTMLSNSARLLRDELGLGGPRPEAVTEFRMAGYVTGPDTLCSGLSQLRAGECLVLDHRLGRRDLIRYYRYLPRPTEDVDPRALAEELAEVTEAMFRRLVEEVAGRPILVPLSGGLDSRLIVCMLRHLGCDNVQTFSYGPPGNHEAKVARHVARTLGYPWRFVPLTHRNVRAFFWTPARRDYWAFCDGLSSIPNMQDLLPLLLLREQGGLPEGAVVVNGQSGDYITGGHLPARLLDGSAGPTEMGEAVVPKHFALRKSLLTPGNRARAIARILAVQEDLVAGVGGLPQAALYEGWEWQERQSKYVVNGQRVYDWLGLDWRLPLWDFDYFRFWSRVPFAWKVGQRLYKDYLAASDYFGLFRNYAPTVWRWSGPALAVVPLARLAGLLAGRRAKQCIYEYARYVGYYGCQFAPWGLHRFLKEARDARSALTFYVETWLAENGLGQLGAAERREWGRPGDGNADTRRDGCAR